MGGLHEIDGCPLYVLNIKDTSPVVHVLTKISKDTISITDVSDNCSCSLIVRYNVDLNIGLDMNPSAPASFALSSISDQSYAEMRIVGA